jgi:mRNA interferase RelE/StbE
VALTSKVATSKARGRFSDLLNRVAYRHDRILLERHGKVVAAIVPAEDLALLEELEDRLDLDEARASLAEAAVKGTRPWEKIKAALGRWVDERTYRVELTPKAERQLKKLPVATRARLEQEIDALMGDPRPLGAKKLSGELDLYRVRVGDYRVLYQIRDKALLVIVAAVGHRRFIYR